jgi:soluble epoxide hydrolase/lipid-phosphate phosphatase
MALDPIDPVSDPRVTHKTTVLNGQTYHYLYAAPESGNYTHTVFLIHGFPDLSMGWRYQIPLLVDMGFRVCAPDMMGYGGTAAPTGDISLYGFKRAADDIAALAKELSAPQIILGGHDWGGFVVWRAAQWHADLVTHVFSVCTPYNAYTAPSRDFASIEDLVKGPLPQLAYQLHLASGEVEKSVTDEQSIRQFLKGMYGGLGPKGETVIVPEKGVQAENLSVIGESRLLNEKMLDYYVKEYTKHGIHPTLNWYRTRKTNWEEDQALLDKKIINQPVLFIQAKYDLVLKPEMSKGMESYIPNMTRGEVEATHWALTQKPDEVNQLVRQWLEGQGLAKSRSSL